MDTQDKSHSVDPKEVWSYPTFNTPKTFYQRLRFRYRIWRLKNRGVKKCNVVHEARLTGVTLTADMTGKKILEYLMEVKK